MKNNILVIGGTGKTGKRIVNLLNNLGHHVRVGSRSGSPAFDWHNPEGWSAAVEGMEAIYITYQPDLAVPGALEAIEGLVKVAKSNHVKKLVLLSGKGEKEAQLCEQVIIHSGLDHTIVRANWFNQNFSENFLTEGVLAGHVALPFAEAKIPFVDANDIAEVAVKALTEDTHNGEIYELTGTEGLTFEEAVSIIAEATDREIQFTGVSIESYVAALRDHKLPEDFIWLIEYLFTEVLGNPSNSDITHDIEKVLDRKPTSFQEYVEKTASTGVWNLVADQSI
ncbi:NAD(P)H-binding protein [Aquimarina sp. D1M17]|uniref:NmrA family NAD(P)-binding protein n=1 Tax=Aquimarina acroporae TaxID=2937283 RepID=UPI0020C06401|nr:NAD(P)H-binding protein [Aquimarina acroporae]MCK8521545.1 NAD(P)H-binding protein [Aquimarina acroporae]